MTRCRAKHNERDRKKNVILRRDLLGYKILFKNYLERRSHCFRRDARAAVACGATASTARHSTTIIFTISSTLPWLLSCNEGLVASLNACEKYRVLNTGKYSEIVYRVYTLLDFCVKSAPTLNEFCPPPPLMSFATPDAPNPFPCYGLAN